jgi:hypothetical protein
MTDPKYDPIENLLQERFQGPVADDGFSTKVMQRLPRRSRFDGWPAALGALSGLLACGFCLRSAALPQIGWHNWLYVRLSSSEITLIVAAAGTSLLGMALMMAEADDPSDGAIKI